MKYVLALFLALATACSSAAAHSRPRKTIDPVAHAMHYSVSLATMDGDVMCSGSIIDRLVVTAAHCVVGPAVKILWMGREFIPYADVVVVDQDLAFLFVEDLPRGLTLAKEAPRFGASVFIVGNPLGLERSFTKGYVSHPKRDKDLGWSTAGTKFPNPFLQTDALIAPGTSGSPVLNEAGGVVGVVSFMFTGTGLGGAVHLDTIKQSKTRI